ncbi:hypothetical protein [Amycolatopsis sacchari]|uniref:hypothetical protein n=1 Tax=Amycolatopsis sacchari TaxID=115433 RepID=UPI003EC0F624
MPAVSLNEVFAGLAEINWAAMKHAYGPASDVPGLLRKLVTDDPREREIAIDGMYGAVHHQGDVYDCTVAAIPFLLRIAAGPDLPGRVEVLRLVASLGDVDRSDQPVYRGTMLDGQAAAAVAQGCPTLLPLLADLDPEVPRGRERRSPSPTDRRGRRGSRTVAEAGRRAGTRRRDGAGQGS